MRVTLLMLLMSVVLPGCATPMKELTPEEAKRLEVEGFAALALGDYEKVIELGITRAQAGDPEFQFSVGFAMLQWLADPNPRATPKYSERDALDWIYNAAKAGVPQAAAVLTSAYRFGNFTLPKSPELGECWRGVEVGNKDADTCLDAEAETRKF